MHSFARTSEGKRAAKVTNPLLKPLASVIIFASTTGPALSNSFSKSSFFTSKNRFPTYTLFDDSITDLGGPNPAAAPRLCAAPVAAWLAVCTADLTESAVEEACSVAFSVADSACDAAARSSACSADVDELASASASTEAAIELSPCWASVAPSASGSDCVAGSSA